MGIALRHDAELREPAVDLGSDESGGGMVGGVVGVEDPRVDEHPSADRRRGARPESNHPTADVGTLDTREGERTAPTTGLDRWQARIIGGGSHLGRVPADSGVDIGVVDPARGDADQHLARSGGRHGDIVANLDHLRAAVTGEQRGAHRRGCGAHSNDGRALSTRARAAALTR